MKHLFRFFLLMTLRVAVICLITVWGISRVASVGATTMAGSTACGITSSTEGIVVMFVDGDLVPTDWFWSSYTPSWVPPRPGPRHIQHRSLVGYHLWSVPHGGFLQVGVSYPAALVTMLLLYLLLQRRRSSRSSGSLQQRLRAAATKLPRGSQKNKR